MLDAQTLLSRGMYVYLYIYIYTPCLIPPYHIISAGTQVFLSRWNRRPVPIPWDVWIVILPWPYSVPWWNTWHMSLLRWRRKVQDDRIFSSSPVTWLEFLLMTASPDPWLHLPESEFHKKNDDIPTKIVDSFEGVFSPYLLFFWGGRKWFLPLPAFWGDIPSHQLSCQYHQARIIELVTWQKGVVFFVVPPRNVGWCGEISRCWVFLVLFVVSWYFVSSGQSIWLAGKSTSFFQEHRIFKVHFLVV